MEAPLCSIPAGRTARQNGSPKACLQRYCEKEKIGVYFIQGRAELQTW